MRMALGLYESFHHVQTRFRQVLLHGDPVEVFVASFMSSALITANLVAAIAFAVALTLEESFTQHFRSLPVLIARNNKGILGVFVASIRSCQWLQEFQQGSRAIAIKVDETFLLSFARQPVIR